MSKNIIKKNIDEATISSGSRGTFVPPLQPGLKPFKKTELSPFNLPVSNYKSPLVQYDSYDKDWDLRRKQINDLEKKASKVQNFMKKHPNATSSDEDGNPINQFMLDRKVPSRNEKLNPFTQSVKNKKNISESSYTSVSAGEYSGPQELGLKKWQNNLLEPFNITVDDDFFKVSLKKDMKNNVSKTVGMWEKGPDGKYEIPTYDVHTLKEDLAVWFGTKKKPKGSKQPKGPWVDICRKVNGKHPPCGRSDSDTGSYPKCRAAGVAGKMSDSAKRSACQQKRRAEKQDTQSGKGQKPVMTSYKPRKKTNENMKTIRITESELVRIVKKIINEESEMPAKKDKNMRFFKTPINRTTITNNNGATVNIPYDGVNYGYDRFQRKISQLASKQKGLAGVLLVCDTGKFETDYNTHKDIMSDKISPELYPVQDAYDKKILQPYCKQINWEYKDIYKKVRKKDPHIYGN